MNPGVEDDGIDHRTCSLLFEVLFHRQQLNRRVKD